MQLCKTTKESNIYLVRKRRTEGKEMFEFNANEKYGFEVKVIAADLYDDSITREEASELAEHIAEKYGEDIDKVERDIDFQAFMIEENQFRFLD